MLKRFIGKKFKIVFIHTNGNKCSLNAVVNNKKCFWWFLGSSNTHSGSEADMMQIVENIRRNTTVDIDTFNF